MLNKAQLCPVVDTCRAMVKIKTYLFDVYMLKNVLFAPDQHRLLAFMRCVVTMILPGRSDT